MTRSLTTTEAKAMSSIGRLDWFNSAGAFPAQGAAVEEGGGALAYRLNASAPAASALAASIIPMPAEPGISPNFATTISLQGPYAVAAGTTFYTTSLELMFQKNDYSPTGQTLFPGAVPFVNDGTLWNRCLNDYLGTVISSQNFDHITNNGLIVSQAPTGQAMTLEIRSTFGGLTNNGGIFALSTKRGAFAIIDWGSSGDIVNHGIIAAQRAPTVPDGPNDFVYKAYAIIRYNGGHIVNGADGSILAEGTRATAIFADRGHILGPGQTEQADITNAGRIEAVATDARYQSFGIEFNSLDLERMNILNSGTIRADIAISLGEYSPSGAPQALKLVTNLAGGVIDGAMLMSRYDEIVVNNGLIDGAVSMFEGDDLIVNAGQMAGPVDLGSGNDQYLGQAASAAVTVTGNAGLDVLIGGSAADSLDGGDGNDWIQGGGGADILTGGAGADRFVIAAAGESSAAAADLIRGFQSGVDKIDLSAISPTSVTLSASAGVTTLTAHSAGGTVVVQIEGAVTLGDLLQGAAGTALSGTAAPDSLSAAGAVRALYGGDGEDLLVGSAGNDFLDGGAGADVMSGGLGDDVYIVDDPIYVLDQNNVLDMKTDRVIELDGQGIDEIRTYVQCVLPDAVENLVFLGAGGIRVEGNGLDNVMVGNAANNIMAGWAGNDVLIGGGGSDILEAGLGADRFVYRAVTDSTAAAFDIVYLESGMDRIDLTALSVASIGWTQHVENDGISSRTYFMVTVATADGPLTIRVNSDILTMADFLFTAPEPDRQLLGTPNGDTLTGGSGNDTLDGLGSADMLIGKAGNDTYYADDAGDVVVELANQGRDVVYASVDWSINSGAHIEVLSAASQDGTTPLILGGNQFDQDIYGNAGNNLLQGGGGSDYLVGLEGDDSYIVVGSNDRIVELTGQGRDVVYALGNYVLAGGASIEVLSTGNQSAPTTIELVGNELNQDIYGNAGSNLLQGGGGVDYLVGLTGDDNYIVNGNNDHVVEIAGQGRDVVYTKGDYTLDVSVSVEILSAADQSATTAMRLTGSSLDQEIYGNAGANVLDGGGGVDYMGGLGGNDTYFVNGAGDHVIEAAGGGSRDVVYARGSYVLEAGQDIEVLAATQQSATTAMDLTGNNLVNEVYGNNGVNTLNGGGGSDFLAGYGGADTFAFTTALGAGNVDQILDFAVIDDTIALDDAVFTGLATGALAPGAFVNGTAALDADDRILYNAATGQILFDADGNGAGGAVLFASVSAGTVLTAADFTVI